MFGQYSPLSFSFNRSVGDFIEKIKKLVIRLDYVRCKLSLEERSEIPKLIEQFNKIGSIFYDISDKVTELEKKIEEESKNEFRGYHSNSSSGN